MSLLRGIVANAADILIRADEQRLLIQPVGAWVISQAEQLQRLSEGVSQNAQGDVEFDFTRIEALDTFGALLLLDHFSGDPRREPKISSASDAHRGTLDLVRTTLKSTPNLDRPEAPKMQFDQRIAAMQTFAQRTATGLFEMLSLLGEICEGIAAGLRHPTLIRKKEFVAHLQLSSLDAVPIICLVTFLIGIVVAYLFVSQASHYGADIFIAEAVSIGMFREFSPIIVAVIMAGRSGSAFTAQIGTMKMNEEIDAIRALALSPLHVLVIPRVLALVISMPLLVFIGDLTGVAGGMTIAYSFLDMTPETFLSRIHGSLSRRSFIIGLVKAAVFALFIATIGCKLGLSVESNARSVGLSTTASVVKSVVCVIILDALFAVLLQRLEI